jgi:hypothetical protein
VDIVNTLILHGSLEAEGIISCLLFRWEN